jgi:hypothetical protein
MKEATARRLQRPLRLYRRLRPVSSLRIEEIPLGDGRLKKFVDVPWHFYKNDPFWTPPLHADYLGSRLLGMTGLLTPEHPYHRTAEVTHFIAWRGRTPVGRISAAVNHRFNDYHNTAIGFFGHFELIDSPEVAEELLDKAQEWLSARGMAVMRGPGEYSCATHERQGVLIDGFDTPPTVELTHNPPYYAELLEGYGMRKAKDYHAYIVNVQRPRSNRLTELMERVKQRRNITTRSFSMAALRSEIRLVVELYNEAWADNWGFPSPKMTATVSRTRSNPSSTRVWFASRTWTASPRPCWAPSPTRTTLCDPSGSGTAIRTLSDWPVSCACAGTSRVSG